MKAIPTEWFLAIAGFASLSLSSRIMGMINESPDFYAIYWMDNVTILTLVFTITVVLPLLLGFIGCLCSFARKTQILSLLLFAFLVGATGSGISREISDPTGGWMILAICAALAIVVSYAFMRFNVVRVFLCATVLSLPLTLFESAKASNHFLLDSAGPEKESPIASVAYEQTRLPNLVFIILDELPLTTLLDQSGKIDPRRYPNLRALADQANWFRQTSSVSWGTQRAVPAILAGKLYKDPVPKTLPPILRNYRLNLFTILQPTHQMEVWESATQLCPSEICGSTGLSTIALRKLTKHLTVAWLHASLPLAFKHQLPDLESYWIEAGAAKKVAHRRLYPVRRQQFTDFVDSIVKDEKPWLRFGHFLLPHVPFEFLADGTGYTDGNLSHLIVDDNTWTEQPEFVAQNYFCHILQTMFVDKLIGLLIKRLYDIGEYERTTIVITADHGVTHVPGDFRRKPSKLNYVSVISVPLIIKEAYQNQGRLIDIPVQTIDIVPTLLATMGIDLQAVRFDGRNVLAENITPIKERLHLIEGQSYASFETELFPLIMQQVTLRDKWFGDREDGSLEMNFSARSDLIGQPVGQVGRIVRSERVASLDGLAPKTSDKRRGVYAPMYLSGEIEGSEPIGSDNLLFVATLNGKVASVMPAANYSSEFRKIRSMLQPRFLNEGQNVIKLYAVDRESKDPVTFIELKIRGRNSNVIKDEIVFERPSPM